MNSLGYYMTYDETISLIKDIYLVDYWEEREQHAKLLDINNIKLMAGYFNKITFSKLISINERKYDTNVNTNIFGILPKIVSDILIIGDGKISIAGYTVLELLLFKHVHMRPHNYLMYFHCSLEEANNIFQEYLLYLNNYEVQYKYYKSRIIISYGEALDIIIMNEVYKNKNHLLSNIGIKLGFNLKDGIFAVMSGALAIATRSIFFDPTHHNSNDLIYCDRQGLAIILPGFPRSFGRSAMTFSNFTLLQHTYNPSIYSIHSVSEPEETQETNIVFTAANKKTFVNPHFYYQDQYESIMKGLEMNRFQALMDCYKNIDYFNKLPKEIFKYICHYWLMYEAHDARQRLLNL